MFLAIYTARREQNTRKEQELYELLIRIYRDPDVLLQLSGRKQKYADPIEEPNENRELVQGALVQATAQANREEQL